MKWDVLDTRQWASVLWLAVLVVAGVAMPTVRRSSADVAKVFFGSWKLVVVFLSFFGWLALACYLGSVVGIWNPRLVPDTVAWLLASGLGLLLSAREIAKKRQFFRRAVLSTIGLSAFMQFALNLHTFHLAVELVLLPAVTLLVLVTALADPGQRPAQRVAGTLLAIIGVWVVAATVRGLVDSRHELDLRQIGLEFAFSVWFPLVALPFVYVVALVMAYEMVLARPFLPRDRTPPPFTARLGLLVGLNGDLRAVDELPRHAAEHRALVRSSTYSEARASVRRYRAARSERNRAEEEAQARLVRYAGARGTDSDGRVLDQREIKETREALRWLQTCHLGHYSNRGKFRKDLLTDVLLDDFTRQGLPADHGVTMRVREDGQAWYAWRRTPSGQVLGIGQSNGRDDEWLYDAETPPTGFPGTDPSWGSGPFETPPNWCSATVRPGGATVADLDTSW